METFSLESEPEWAGELGELQGSRGETPDGISNDKTQLPATIRLRQAVIRLSSKSGVREICMLRSVVGPPWKRGGLPDRKKHPILKSTRSVPLGQKGLNGL